MRHFPLFLDLAGARVLVAGGGAAAEAKLRLLLKTEARIEVYAASPREAIAAMARAGAVTLHRRALLAEDVADARLVYAATEDSEEDARVAALGRAAGALVNVVDDLEASDVLTPAMVDRDPVTVAIGTEGAAPVLARAIKARMEERLPARLGTLARIGKAFRPAADALPQGRARRAFWADFHFRDGPAALAAGGEAAAEAALAALLDRHLARRAAPGRVVFVGAGPGDPELLTLKARRALDDADVVIHDRLVTPEILELARREAEFVEAGKTGFGPCVPQAEINRLIVAHAAAGKTVVRLKGGDPAVFARLDEEADACAAAGIGWEVVPGITAASAAAATLGRSLTRRGRNGELRLLTGHDVAGFAEQDWRALARPGAVAGIYMGLRAARFLQARLLARDADPDTPVSAVENASRADERVIATTLGHLPDALGHARIRGPVVLMLGLSPHEARAAARGSAPALEPEEAA